VYYNYETDFTTTLHNQDYQVLDRSANVETRF